MTFYNVVLNQWEMVVALPSSPRDAAYEECLNVLMESAFPMAFEEVIKTVCERNQQVAAYIGKSFSLENNKKLRPIVDMLRNHSRIQETKSKPIVFQYKPKDDLIVKASEQASDPSDPSDLTSDTPKDLDEKNTSENEELQKKIFETFDGVSGERSYRSYRSYSIYAHLIKEEDLPSLGRTALRCIEHPDVAYYDQKGIEESHFKPIHG
jgi:hypothetical protein